MDALAGFGGGRRVLLILDDVDRSPDDALAFLEQLGSAACGTAVCAVALVRAVPSDGGPSGPDRPEYLRCLTGLTRDEVSELLAAVSGATRPVELVDSVWSETGGIPSLVTGIGRRLQHLDIKARAEAALTRADDARRGLDRVQDDIAAGVLSGVELAQLRSRRASAAGNGCAGWRDVSVQRAGIVRAVRCGAVLRARAASGHAGEQTRGQSVPGRDWALGQWKVVAGRRRFDSRAGGGGAAG